jgi:hypothetical protein
MVSLNEGLLLFGAATAVEAATPFMALGVWGLIIPDDRLIARCYRGR